MILGAWITWFFIDSWLWICRSLNSLFGGFPVLEIGSVLPLVWVGFLMFSDVTFCLRELGLFDFKLPFIWIAGANPVCKIHVSFLISEELLVLYKSCWIGHHSIYNCYLGMLFFSTIWKLMALSHIDFPHPTKHQRCYSFVRLCGLFVRA